MSCSVKFLEPMTMRFAFRSQAMTGKRSRKTRSVQMISQSGRGSNRSSINVSLRCLSQMFMSMFNLRFRPQRTQPPLKSSEHKVGKKRQQRRWNGPRQNHLVVHHAQSAENKLPQSARADRCRNRCQSYGEHRRNSQSGHNHSRSQRQLHLKEQLAVGQSHGASRLDHRRIDAADARVSIANQRQQRIERQRQDRKPASAFSNPRRWKKKAEQ